MSTFKTVTVTCDAKNCEQRFPTGRTSLFAALEQASDCGWTVGRSPIWNARELMTADYCPVHAEMGQRVVTVPDGTYRGISEATARTRSAGTEVVTVTVEPGNMLNGDQENE